MGKTVLTLGFEDNKLQRESVPPPQTNRPDAGIRGNPILLSLFRFPALVLSERPALSLSKGASRRGDRHFRPSVFRPLFPVSGFSVPRIPLRALCDLCGETIPPACHGVVPARRDGGRARQLVKTSPWQTQTKVLTQGRFLFPVEAQSALDIFRQRYPVVRGQLLQEIVFCHL